MKKAYEAPTVNSLRFVFAEGVAADAPTPDYNDLLVTASSLLAP